MKKSEYLKLPLFSEKMKEVILGMIVKQKMIVPLALNQVLQNIEYDYLDKHKEYLKTPSIRMLDLRKDGDFFVILYLPLYKEPEYTVNNKWTRKNRQEGKIGRMIRTFLNPYLPLIGSQIKDSDLEDFVNGIKSYLSRDTLTYKLVKGDDIAKYYLHENYADFCNNNTLHNSCMSDEDCQTYFDLYTKNPDCELLIMFDKTISEEKIVGRAIVWNKNGQKYVDRRYYMLDMYHASMVEYIKSQGWCYKTHNCFSNNVSMTFSCPDGKGNYEVKDDVELTYSYEGKDIEQFPYMDTVKYWNFSILSNNEDVVHGKVYELCYTNGCCRDEDEDEDEDFDETVVCARCGARMHYDDSRYDDCIDESYCYDCAVLDLTDNFINVDNATEVHYRDGVGYIHIDNIDEYAIKIGEVYYLLEDQLEKEGSAYFINEEDSRLDEESVKDLLSKGFIQIEFEEKQLIYLPYVKENKTETVRNDN